MNKGAIIFLATLIGSIFVTFLFVSNQPITIVDSDSDYYDKELPLILPNLDPIIPQDNLTKGMTFICNFSVISLTNKKLVVPLDFKLYIIRNCYSREISAKEAGFYDFYAPTVFVLDPFRLVFSLVTLEISEDVDLGEYQLFIGTGDWEVTHVSGISLNFKVVT
ncbi:MAG: hypothetical protein AC479_02210 [miscellaneous Crenarchaeota group-6 archaeon AD8-1]|nr:MAG: hypothetical protein AC479_02210 [miscellaneous Crenarchaeota group-6 archaeon AD8-1]